jgi:hypothetical protein
MKEAEATDKKLAVERDTQAELESSRLVEKEVAAAAAAEKKSQREDATKALPEQEGQMQKEAEEQARLEEVRAAATRAEEERLFNLCQEAQRAKGDKAEQARRASELAAARERVNGWCKKNSFSDLNSQKKTVRGATKFPLHTAVKQNDGEIVELLLKCGADHNAKDSRQQTPAELAATLNRSGSHDKIASLLR